MSSIRSLKTNEKIYKWKNPLYCPACDAVIENYGKYHEEKDMLYHECEHCSISFFQRTKIQERNRFLIKWLSFLVILIGIVYLCFR